MPPDPDPPFLERRSYRRRRWMDAAHILPWCGALLFALPVLWAAGPGGSTARGGIYLFGVWAVLILAARLLSRVLTPDAPEPDRDAEG